MVVEIRRYLGNTLSVHSMTPAMSTATVTPPDLEREPALVRHLEEARSDLGYRTAPGALGGSDDRRSVGATSSMTLNSDNCFQLRERNQDLGSGRRPP